jgi:polyisoprenyl-phosphate glycosyltransferase
VTVCAVIPAYNEAGRIARVLTTLAAAPSVGRILVIDDGSTDGTADVVRTHPAASSGKLTVAVQPNSGKGAAMRHGAEQAGGADVLLFFDADLIGLTVEHVESLLAPGQRAIQRDLFLSIPGVAEARYGVELAITGFVMDGGLPVARVVLKDVSHPPKERKLGLVRGVASRARMYRQMMPFLLRRYALRRKRR